ncbi:MAG TPA: hypothetical protein VFI74_01030 [Candidatus Saccharimonadales bacterium]|nr:hypothetical protein [Candidatus Saccharimonadales bacterium]
MSKSTEISQQNITDEMLSATSIELWGDPVYGATANTFFDRERSDKGCAVWLTDRGYVLSTIMGDRIAKPSIFTEPLDIETNADIKDVARTASKDIRYRHTLPFALTLRMPGEEDEEAAAHGLAFKLEPAQLVHSHLKKYITRRGWHDHRLHGTLGKAMDVLKASVGYKPNTVRTARQNDQEFISREDLKAQAVQAIEAGELMPHYQRDFSDKVSRGGYEQVCSGQPIAWGEVILEGAASFGFRSAFTWERVAVSSLVSIGLNAYRPNARGGPEFLLQTFGRKK